MIRAANKQAALLARLVRPQNNLYGFGLIILSGCLFGINGAAIACCCLLIYCLYSVAVVVNNTADVLTDRINRRYENLWAHGTMGKHTIVRLVIANTFCILFLQFLLQQPATLVLSLLYIGVLIAYSAPPFSLQSRGWIAYPLLATCYGAVPLTLALAQTTKIDNPWHIAGLQVLLLSPFLLAKDYKDLAGDKTTGKRTPIVRYGKQTVMKTALATGLLGNLVALGSISGSNSRLGFLALACVYIWLLLRLHLHNGLRSLIETRATQLVLLLQTYLLLISQI